MDPIPASRFVDVAIVGGGFSGTMVAIHLVRLGGAKGPRVALIDPVPEPGRGLAYHPTSPRHLLNVPAGGMSALPDDPAHFVAYLRSCLPAAGPADFVPRSTFGDYVSANFRECATSAPGRDRLVHLREHAAGIVEGDGGYRLELTGGPLLARTVVLAMGNALPRTPTAITAAGLATDGRYVADPWRPAAFDRVLPDQPVLLCGSGLTMADVALSLDDLGHRAPIFAVSRRGLLPTPHRGTFGAGGPVYVPPDLAARSGSVRRLVREVRDAVRRAEAAGVDWRAVVAELRPMTAQLWRGLAPEERERFLRHVGRMWEVHRHRAPPTTDGPVRAQITAGRLRVIAGRLVSLTERAGHLEAAIRLRGGEAVEMLRVGTIVNCRGPEADPARMGNPLMDALLRGGLARPGPHSLGLDAEVDGAVIGRDGRRSSRLFALGPLLRGVLLETTAVPEIRGQARAVAEAIVGR